MGALSANCAVGMTTARGEIVGAHHNGSSVDLAPATDMVGGREAGDPSILVVVRKACEATDLAKAASVEQQIDTLPAGGRAATGLPHHARTHRHRREAVVGHRLQTVQLRGD